MNWLQKLLPPKIKRSIGPSKRAVPEGLWIKCGSCDAVLYATDLEKNLNVCPKCNYHNRLPARARIEMLLDPEGRFEIGAEVLPVDSLKFKDSKRYADRLEGAQRQTGESDALVVMQGAIKNIPLVAAVFEFDFMGGSMGSVVGEKIARAIERAIERKIPLVVVSCSGGARMQEGILSLMQMAKTSALLAVLAARKLPYISVLLNPTTAGVMASYASLGDIIVAEPKALLGFAGPRVIQQTIGQDLPEGFQSSEFFLEHGFLDIISERKDLRRTVALCLEFTYNPPAGD